MGFAVNCSAEIQSHIYLGLLSTLGDADVIQPVEASNDARPCDIQSSPTQPRSGVWDAIKRLPGIFAQTALNIFLLASLLTGVIGLMTVADILVGLLLVATWDSVVGQSFGNIPACWHYLKIAWLGAALLGAALAVVISVAFDMNEVYTRTPEGGPQESQEAATEQVKQRQARRLDILVACACVTASAAAMAIGVIALRSWNGIDAITASPVRSVVVTFVGSVANCGLMYIITKRPAVRRSGEDVLPTTRS